MFFVKLIKVLNDSPSVDSIAHSMAMWTGRVESLILKDISHEFGSGTGFCSKVSGSF